MWELPFLAAAVSYVAIRITMTIARSAYHVVSFLMTTEERTERDWTPTVVHRGDLVDRDFS